MRRLLPTISAAAVATALALAPAASAHVTVSPPSVPADGYAKLDFRVPHGCEASPTTKVTIQIPDGINSVTPQVVPGWTINKEMAPLDPPVDDGHGGQLTERVASVSWTGGPLASDQLEEFGLSLRTPNQEGPLEFPTVQNCPDGVERWIEPTVDGEPEPDKPAPVLHLTAASADAHAPAASAAAPEADNSRANLALGFGIAGLILGGAGLATGLIIARRK